MEREAPPWKGAPPSGNRGAVDRQTETLACPCVKTHCNEDLTFVHALYLNVPISLSGKNEIAVFVTEEGTMRRDCDVCVCACERDLSICENIWIRIS